MEALLWETMEAAEEQLLVEGLPPEDVVRDADGEVWKRVDPMTARALRINAQLYRVYFQREPGPKDPVFYDRDQARMGVLRELSNVPDKTMGLYRAKRAPGIFCEGKPPIRTPGVYVVQTRIEEHGPCKIGESEDIASRLSALQTAHPWKLKLRYYEVIRDRATRCKREDYLHTVLRNYRLEGEWFEAHALEQWLFTEW